MAHAATLLAAKTPTILADDFNVIPISLDAANPHRWLTDALFRPESRMAYRQLLEQGWIDSLRALHPTGQLYTY